MCLAFTCYDVAALHVPPFGLETRGDLEISRELLAEIRQFVVTGDECLACQGSKNLPLRVAFLLVSTRVTVTLVVGATLGFPRVIVSSRAPGHDCDWTSYWRGDEAKVTAVF